MNWSHRFLRLLPSVAVILLCASCSDFWVSSNSIQTVTVTPTGALLKASASPADSITLSSTSTTVGGTTATDTTTATWSSSNNAVATVNAGVVTAASTAAATQTATITATDGGVNGTCNVLIYTGEPTLSITLPSGVVQSSVAPGTSFQLTATLTGITGNVAQYIAWSTNDSSMATVSSTGVVYVQSTAPASTQFTVTATPNVGAEGTAIAAQTITFTTAI